MTDRPERSPVRARHPQGARSARRSQARPAPGRAQPGHVRGRGRRRAHDADLDRAGVRRRAAGRRRRPGLVHVHGRGLAVADRRLRELRRGDRRGPRQGAGRRAARDAHRDGRARSPDGGEKPATELRKGDVVVVEAGEVIPGDGTVIEGIASVDESAITGESAPVIRESGGDRSAVTGGTRVLSDRIVVEITQEPGQSFLDRMIRLVEGAERRKTPNEIALSILLAGLTIIFLAVVVDAAPVRGVRRHRRLDHDPDRAARLADPDDDRRAAERDRHRRHGPARAPQRARALGPRRRGVGRRRRAAARQDRHDHARQPPGRRVRPDARRRRRPSSPRPRSTPRWPTRRPRAARSSCWPSSTACASTSSPPTHAQFVPFTAQTRMSGVDLDGTRLRKGAGDAILRWVADEGGQAPPELQAELDRVAPRGLDAAGRRARLPGARRDRAQGRRQGGHARALRAAAARWASARSWSPATTG